MKTRLTVILLALLWIYPFSYLAYSQPEKFISRSYFMKDGLSHNYVICMLQDSKGFIWAGTESGLNKFDGYHFTTYRENPLDTNSLRNNHITALWEDKQQRLWVGTSNGLELFDLKTKRFLNEELGGLSSSEGVDIYIQKFRERKDGSLWICTDHGVFLADSNALFITKPIDFPLEIGRSSTHRDNLNGNHFWDIAETNDGSIWAASEDGLVHVDTFSGRAEKSEDIK